MTCGVPQNKKAAESGLKLNAQLADFPLGVWGREVQPLAARAAFYTATLPWGLRCSPLHRPKEKAARTRRPGSQIVLCSKSSSLMPPLGPRRRECRNMVNEWLARSPVKPLEGRRVTFVQGLEDAVRGRYDNAARSALTPSKAGETR